VLHAAPGGFFLLPPVAFSLQSIELQLLWNKEPTGLLLLLASIRTSLMLRLVFRCCLLSPIGFSGLSSAEAAIIIAPPSEYADWSTPDIFSPAWCMPFGYGQLSTVCDSEPGGFAGIELTPLASSGVSIIPTSVVILEHPQQNGSVAMEPAPTRPSPLHPGLLRPPKS
jgi:hypothetical protein